MRIDPPFPADRRSDPMRRAELRIYLQLAQSGVAGRALYQVRAGERCRELDFLVFLTRGTRIGIEVKGGDYRLADGEWRLRTPDGWQRKPSPLVQLQEAVGSCQEVLGHRQGRGVFILPVLAFPDMKEAPDIDALAGASGARVLWGTGRFADRLVGLAEASGLFDLATAGELEAEITAITAGT